MKKIKELIPTKDIKSIADYFRLYRLMAEFSFECAETVSIKKYLWLPHYTIFKLLEK